jgi:hypothetical protein
MFDDIIKERRIEELGPKELKMRICDNCANASHILSKFKDRILCLLYSKHKMLDYHCNKWKKINNN